MMLECATTSIRDVQHTPSLQTVVISGTYACLLALFLGGQVRQFSFKGKVLLLAITLVMAIQLVTLFPVLNVLRHDAEEKAWSTVNLGGVVFDEFMHNRTEQLLTTVEVLVSDFGFKQAFASGDRPTIRSALINHAGRAGASVALLLDLDGKVLVSSTGATQFNNEMLLPRLDGSMDLAAARHAVTYLDGIAYQTVTVSLRAPVPVAQVMLGFEIDQRFAEHVQRLTGLHASILRFDVDRAKPVGSTLPVDQHIAALSGLHVGGQHLLTGSLGNEEYLTLLRPFLNESGELYIAIQTSVRDALQSYFDIRKILYIITAVSLLIAITAAIFVANSVTRPVQELAAAARRMREGIYTEAINIDSSDEFGELATGFNSMQEAIADRERHIFHIAHHDSLSGLPNRELVVSQLRDTLEHVDSLTVISLALSRFNRIVSSLGHRAGDEVIKLVAGLLRNRTEEGQILGHVNRQEFFIVLPGYDIDGATEFVSQVTDSLRAGVDVSGANISLQTTAGIATYPGHCAEAAELLRCASIARSDAQFRVDPVVIYRVGQEDHAVQQIRIVGDFPKAIKNNEFELYFQPKISCNTREVIGAEALVRWEHPELGLLMPDSFIDAIEQAGGIAHLTRWVLARASQHCAEWRAAGLDIELAVNISVDDLVDEFLPYYLLDICRQSELKPTDITLEVTESAIMHNVQMSLSVVSCIRELGFRVAIDDFGTGQSSLAQLKRLPVDELKIDKSFVMNMQSSCDEAIVRTAIELGHQLGFSVVAEGVESAEVLERLHTLGCEVAQGFYITAPIAGIDFVNWVRGWHARQNPGIVTIVNQESKQRSRSVRS